MKFDKVKIIYEKTNATQGIPMNVQNHYENSKIFLKYIE